jgi:hypothetical protein
MIKLAIIMFIVQLDLVASLGLYCVYAAAVESLGACSAEEERRRSRRKENSKGPKKCKSLIKEELLCWLDHNQDMKILLLKKM